VLDLPPAAGVENSRLLRPGAHAADALQRRVHSTEHEVLQCIRIRRRRHAGGV
jgi:hypothetical protein